MSRAEKGFSLGTSLVVASTLILGGCCTFTPRTATGAGTRALTKKDLKCDIQMVYVTRDGHTIPKVVEVIKDVQIVIWVADADELHIDFGAHNPFPKVVDCEGRFCGLIIPPNGAAGTYDYTGYVKTGATQTPLDPQLEVVKK
jgi:hypothetical protein